MMPIDQPFGEQPTGYPGTRLGNLWGDDTFLAGFGDGRVRRVPRSADPKDLQAAITRAGREPFDVRRWGAEDRKADQ